MKSLMNISEQGAEPPTTYYISHIVLLISYFIYDDIDDIYIISINIDIN